VRKQDLRSEIYELFIKQLRGNRPDVVHDVDGALACLCREHGRAAPPTATSLIELERTVRGERNFFVDVSKHAQNGKKFQLV
jgi:hypothetical protein